jgi:hypothetical protein
VEEKRTLIGLNLTVSHSSNLKVDSREKARKEEAERGGRPRVWQSKQKEKGFLSAICCPKSA